MIKSQDLSEQGIHSISFFFLSLYKALRNLNLSLARFSALLEEAVFAGAFSWIAASLFVIYHFIHRKLWLFEIFLIDPHLLFLTFLAKPFRTYAYRNRHPLVFICANFGVMKQDSENLKESRRFSQNVHILTTFCCYF